MMQQLIGGLRIALVFVLLTMSACISETRDAPGTTRRAPPASRGAGSARASGESASIANFSLPRPVGFVNDFAGVVPAETRSVLSDTLRRIQELTGGEIVLVVLPDLARAPVEALARRIGNEWGVGSRSGPARNAGVVVLIVPKESSTDGRGYCRIEFGDGAAAFLPDSVATSLCKSAIPAFRLREYGEGLRLITLELARRFVTRWGTH